MQDVISTCLKINGCFTENLSTCVQCISGKIYDLVKAIFLNCPQVTKIFKHKATKFLSTYVYSSCKGFVMLITYPGIYCVAHDKVDST